MPRTGTAFGSAGGWWGSEGKASKAGTKKFWQTANRFGQSAEDLGSLLAVCRQSAKGGLPQKNPALPGVKGDLCCSRHDSSKLAVVLVAAPPTGDLEVGPLATARRQLPLQQRAMHAPPPGRGTALWRPGRGTALVEAETWTSVMRQRKRLRPLP